MLRKLLYILILATVFGCSQESSKNGTGESTADSSTVAVPKQELEAVTSGMQRLLEKDSLNEAVIQGLKEELTSLTNDSTYLKIKPDSTAVSEVPVVINEAKKDTTVKPAGDCLITNEHPVEKDADIDFLFLFLAFLSGLVVLLTPCVFPLIPMTVSFFTKKQGTRGVRDAFIYGTSIVIIYTILGVLMSVWLGPTAANELASDKYLNIIFFAIFLLFGISFLGMFEINLPSNFTTSVDKQADKGGLIGIFFMAFTLVVVSFSCTGPIVGSLLVVAAYGDVWTPIAGMVAFSSGIALPFMLFALFPSMLKGLPQSGGWLNSVKVVLGFLELGLAFKFFSNADLANHWDLLSRDVFIAIWVVIALLLGIYLIGKLRLPHDSPLEKVSVPRTILAIVFFVFSVYLIPGLFGAPLKALAGILPPMGVQEFVLTDGSTVSVKEEATTCKDIPPKYNHLFHLPHGLEGYYDLAQALACAKALNKPVFVDFTGHTCANCRRMEEFVWVEKDVHYLLNNKYVIVSLYVDDKTPLPESEWKISANGEPIETIGKKNAYLQIDCLGTNAQPYYALLGPDGFTLVDPVGGYMETEEFKRFLEEGLEKFQQLY